MKSLDRRRYPAITEDGWRALEKIADFTEKTDEETQRQVLMIVTMANTMQKMFERKDNLRGGKDGREQGVEDFA